MYNFSSAVIPRPLDWPDSTAICGYWFIKEDDKYDPPAGLADFIEKAKASDKKLLYIGFGSALSLLSTTQREQND